MVIAMQQKDVSANKGGKEKAVMKVSCCCCLLNPSLPFAHRFDFCISLLS